MKFLPSSLVAVDASGRPLPAQQSFRRVGAMSPEGRLLSEADWDKIICANVEALAEALRAADVLPEDSTLRVLGRQIDCVDVLLAEVPSYDAGKPGEDDLPEIRRLVLLEDKLMRNPEAKRQVLAQALDYAERVQRTWTTEFLCSISSLARQAVWLQSHSQRLDVSLAEGDLLVIIAGDDIDDDLLRLARRFAGGNNPLSLNELCLVAMALYRRGEEHLLVPHVVSSVERHQRQFTIRVRVQDLAGTPLRATVERDVEADIEAARGGAVPINPDVQAFLRKAKSILDPRLMADGSPYDTTTEVKKLLQYEAITGDGSRIRFKVHFGGYTAHFSPIQVGLYVETKTSRDEWRARLEQALAEKRLPVGTKLTVAGKLTISALKEYEWSTPVELSESLLRDVTDTVLTFESEFGLGRTN